MMILGIETSCDETAVAVLEGTGDPSPSAIKLRSNIIASQIALHRQFGGVVPEVASRCHVETIIPVMDEALSEAGVSLSDITVVAATHGPGLVGAVLVGLSAAKALALAQDIPFVGVNHIEAHMYANFIEHPDLAPPFVCLVVSGGHSDLVYLKDYGDYEVMGRTRDDAAGEAFDKVARTLGLSYPGGPAIDLAAREGDSQAVRFPRAFLEEGSYDFSFSGLKTAVVNYVANARRKEREVFVPDIAASFQEAVVDVLVTKTLRAACEIGVNTVALAGGVAANSRLRQELSRRAIEKGMDVRYPSPILCTDNAAMVACVGYFRLVSGELSSLDLPAVPNLHLE
ncbi:MAG: tRNA (adenosine(37)-N6)-threonylcarbamoyltransferase complex transferase subunit TsaD [Firmicutes bacterium]|jgi:N6-L-threonylcarbamoyladenine synthase|nr:tRNA (adenosine(37)-N6)-threonylcarbamoyltransferase complex transferase subunit TsaD [Bacillota bacterium]